MEPDIKKGEGNSEVGICKIERKEGLIMISEVIEKRKDRSQEERGNQGTVEIKHREA